MAVREDGLFNTTKLAPQLVIRCVEAFLTPTLWWYSVFPSSGSSSRCLILGNQNMSRKRMLNLGK